MLAGIILVAFIFIGWLIEPSDEDLKRHNVYNPKINLIQTIKFALKTGKVSLQY